MASASRDPAASAVAGFEEFDDNRWGLQSF